MHHLKFPIALLILIACDLAPAGGERFGPSDDCLAAIACASAVDADNASLYDGAYGQDAECWANAADALRCTQDCQAEIEAQAVSDPTEAACWPGATPEARWLFQAHPLWQFSSTTSKCYDAVATFSGADSGPDFSLSLVFQTGGSTSMESSLDAELAFVAKFAKDGHDYVYSGSFSDDFTKATLESTSDGDPLCAYEGVPGGS